MAETKTIGVKEVTKEEIIAFAKRYDPQPFHLDEEAAKASMIGRLCASGWHVCAMLAPFMWEGGEIVRIEECRWQKPVFPGDRLTLTRALLETKGREARFLWEAHDQNGEKKTQITGWQKINGEAE